MDYYNLKTSDNLCLSKQVEYLRSSVGIKKSWIFQIVCMDQN